MNVCVFSGRLAAPPHVKGKGAFFTLAVQQNFKREDGSRGAEFLSMAAYGKYKESVEKYLTTGDIIAVRCTAQSYKKEDCEQVIFKLEYMTYIYVKHFQNIKEEKEVSERPNNADIDEE